MLLLTATCVGRFIEASPLTSCELMLPDTEAPLVTTLSPVIAAYSAAESCHEVEIV